MLDINTIVPPMLKGMIRLEPFYPDVVTDFPLGILTPMDAGAGVILAGAERLTPVRFQIDVYHTSPKACELAAAAVAAQLVQRGFNREAGNILREDGLYRHVLTFFANIDEQTGLIYRA